MREGSTWGLFFGVGAAIGIHQLSWWLRQRCLPLLALLGTVWVVIATAGIIAAAVITHIATIASAPQPDPRIAVVLICLGWLVFLVTACGLGVLHASLLGYRWWHTTTALFFESLVGSLVGYVLASTYLPDAILWPISWLVDLLEIDGGTTCINSFQHSAFQTLVASLFLLALLCPLWRRHRLKRVDI